MKEHQAWVLPMVHLTNSSGYACAVGGVWWGAGRKGRVGVGKPGEREARRDPSPRERARSIGGGSMSPGVGRVLRE